MRNPRDRLKHGPPPKRDGGMPEASGFALPKVRVEDAFGSSSRSVLGTLLEFEFEFDAVRLSYSGTKRDRSLSSASVSFVIALELARANDDTLSVFLGLADEGDGMKAKPEGEPWCRRPLPYARPPIRSNAPTFTTTRGMTMSIRSRSGFYLMHT